MAQVYAPVYNKGTSGSDLGIPIKVTADINEKIYRPTLQVTYESIISDLKNAVELLPDTAVYRTRPSKLAAYAQLARTYLSMGDYENALSCANSALKLKATLLDYNKVPVSPGLQELNDEVIFHSVMIRGVDESTPISGSRILVDTLLYRSYDGNDLRKTFYFRTTSGRIIMGSRSYAGPTLFTGLAVDEVMLIRAECNARKGSIMAAADDINALLKLRYATGKYALRTYTDPALALEDVLKERRKELVRRGLRWTDLRRLNLEPNLAKTLKRIVGAEVFTLAPNDKRYTFPIPPSVIAFYPDMVQNQR